MCAVIGSRMCWCKIQAQPHTCLPRTRCHETPEHISLAFGVVLILHVYRSSLLFSLLWELKNEQGGQESKLQGPGGTVGESHGSSPDMRQTRSCHQGVGDTVLGRGQLSGEAECNEASEWGRKVTFLLLLPHLSPAALLAWGTGGCGVHGSLSWAHYPMCLSAVGVTQTLNLDSICANTWLALEPCSLPGRQKPWV